jgi:hypothetical protein
MRQLARKNKWQTLKRAEPEPGLFFGAVKKKWSRWMVAVFLALFALSRWPGLFPLDFSPVYALAVEWEHR